MKHDASWLAGAADGRLISSDKGVVARGQVCVDTRLLHSGDVFLALPGSRTSGGEYIADAIKLGADGVIAQAAQLERAAQLPIAVAVAEPREALRSIARARREEFDGHAIAVTGSTGKTTTTEMIASLLDPLLDPHATRDGFNTHLGVAATMAGLPDRTRALVVELSMQARGQIAEKAALLRPTAAVITNIAPAHLQSAGSVADIARNKAELLAALPPGAPCVVPAEEPLLEPYLRDDLMTVRHGRGGDFQLLDMVDGVARIDCAGRTTAVRSGFSQPHNLDNLVAAVALISALGMRPAEEVGTDLPPLRWQLGRLGKAELVLDCFNNSPLALRAALEAFAAESALRRLAVLGAFEELGSEARRYHRAAGVEAGRLGIDAIITVGEPSRQYLDGYPGESYSVDTPEQARVLLGRIARDGDRVLVKGPRNAQLERIAK
ncbi:MAG: Mur ligase family protein [Solirubrobacterales bacterium]